MSYLSKSAASALCALAVLTGVSLAPKPALAGADPFIGDIMMVGFNFCPRNWAPAAGQLLPISQNTALFSLLGTSFGGDGRTTFGLPDLRGRNVIGRGVSTGTAIYVRGRSGGSETATMAFTNIPSHNHVVNANNLDGDKAGPGGKLLAAAPTGGTGNETIYSDQAANVQMNPAMIGSTGNGIPFATRDPYLAVTYCIALVGIYPSQN